MSDLFEIIARRNVEIREGYYFSKCYNINNINDLYDYLISIADESSRDRILKFKLQILKNSLEINNDLKPDQQLNFLLKRLKNFFLLFVCPIFKFKNNLSLKIYV